MKLEKIKELLREVDANPVYQNLKCRREISAW